MSLTKTQLDALIKRNCKIESTNTISYPVADMTADENLALDNAIDILLKNSGTWQFDDPNHTDSNTILTNLVDGQRNYSFTVDGSGNLILDIYKVMVSNDNGVSYQEIYPVDKETDPGMESFYDGRNVEGDVYRYNKTGNGIELDQIPKANVALGLKVFINREGSHFTVTDSSKMPGIPGLYHEYIALDCSVRYCKRNKMFALADRYAIDLALMEKKMTKGIGQRERDTRKVIGQNITRFI
jgi:hypothetical protein